MHNQHPPPDFVIAGAAKCGTTALYQYFREHPKIFMTNPKEPHYFADDLYNPHYITEEQAYLQLFANAPEGTIRGEASVHYINSNNAIDRIMANNPDTKIFVLLRNPIELVRSWHAQLRFSGQEDIKDLESAWDIQAKRARGQQLPERMAIFAGKLQYRDICAIGKQTAKIVSKVPKEQLLILLLDDLKQDPETFYSKASAFLDVGYQPFAPKTVINSSRRSRSVRLARFLFWSKFINSSSIRGLSPLFYKLGFHPLRMLRQANSLPNVHAQISEKFRQKLYEAFSEDIDIIEGLLNRRLDNWRT